MILDEAQDTTPAQFSVLLESVRPPGASGDWLETRANPPPAGRFCMVGDFQQSIYRDRSELDYYRAVHDALVSGAGGEELEFSVTFRLDQKQLDFVNETFCEILNDRKGQVRFVELHPRPDILPGKVIRVPLGKELLGEGKKLKDYQKGRIEADFLARWIKDADLKKLSAESWRDVAILCPRKAWLQTIAAALRRVKLPVAIQSERDVNGDSPAYAWLTALLTIMTDPRNAYEIVGVLRDIFGVSDHDLAVFSEAQSFRFRIDEELSAVGKVSSHLRALAKTWQHLTELSLFDAVVRVVEETHLRERLQLLPATEFGDLGRELDVLLAQAAEGEASGLILAEFAERLRDDFTTPRAIRFAANDNAIQLITSHKAKGSEWQAVILPFLGRDLRVPSPRYPDLVRSPASGKLLVALNGADKSKEIKKALDLAHEQATERLLYVATTRARRTLVLVLDQEIFATAKGELPKNAQLRRLIRGENSYSGEFDEHSCTIASVEDRATLTSTPETVSSKVELNSRELKRAVQRASEFVHKFNPSGYDEEIPFALGESGGAHPRPAISLVRSRADTPATLYGRWWHLLLQQISWSVGVEEAEAIFLRHLSRSPEKNRSIGEWKLAREKLFSDSVLMRFLSGGKARSYPEFPFVWSIDNHGCVEGVIDLLVIEESASRCLLVDWKTNRIAEGEEEKLRQRYLAQIAAYWTAVRQITKFRVEAAVYSTANGNFLLYNENELDAEWTRLRALPPDQFVADVSAP